ncbi:MAG: alanine--glyoxylate aminotransferase family protein [Alphaproteobacteria bacterium]|nr:MAG: alanine--glyoxylate aminotransferase family protein [Alphaproteobacteria bacterium]
MSRPPRRLLLGAGPSPIPEPVRLAAAQATVGHLDPWFQDFMESLKQRLRQTFVTRNRMTFPFSAPASAAMESALFALADEGDEIAVIIHGAFGARLAEMARRQGLVVHRLDVPWGSPPDPQQLEDLLTSKPDIRLVAFVHAETSTGVAADAATLARIAEAHDCLVLMDAVTSLGGSPVLPDQWGIDFTYSGSQKCLSAPPGLAPVTVSERALEWMNRRRRSCRSWFGDMLEMARYWDGQNGRSYHHTAPINALYALDAALRLFLTEGHEAAHARHYRAHLALLAGLEALGLELLPPPGCRLPQLNAVVVPAGIDEAQLRADLLSRHGIEISAGLGSLAGRILRIGLMGDGARLSHVLTLLVGLEDALARQGWTVTTGSAPQAAIAAHDRARTAEHSSRAAGADG